MQQWTIRFCGQVHETVTTTGCSIATALEKHIREASPAYLEKLREATFDLDRILQLEIGRRQEIDQEIEDAIRFPVTRGDGRVVLVSVPEDHA